MASDPPSSTLRTVWTSSELGMPSSVTPMCRKSLARIEKSLRRSSLPATPGSVCTARIGSSASNPRRFWSSALPIEICDATPGASRGNEIALDFDVFFVGAGTLGQRNREIERPSRRHVHVTPREPVADERHLQDPGPGRQVGQEEPSLGTCHDAAWLSVEHHARVLQRLSRARVHDEAAHRPRQPLSAISPPGEDAHDERREAGPDWHRRHRIV